MLTVNHRRPDGLRFYGEIQPRFGDNYKEFTQLIVRPAVGYQVGKKTSVWLGYAWTPSYFPADRDESRLFQQLLIEDLSPRFDLINRTRLEERFIGAAGGTSLRLRHQVRAVTPLSRRGRRWTAVASDELFWNLNGTPNGPTSGFDQNRAFLGASYGLSRQTRLEFGYLRADVNPPRNRPDRRLDVLMVTLNHTI
jgi:hypothetical protein